MPQNILSKIGEPGFDVKSLSAEEKIKLVKESNGLLVDILEGVSTESLNLSDCTE